MGTGLEPTSYKEVKILCQEEYCGGRDMAGLSHV